MKLDAVPQVFYDLIARLIPGTILIWCSYLVNYGLKISLEHLRLAMNYPWQVFLLTLLITLLIAYILSNILSGFITLITDNLKCKKSSIFKNYSNDIVDFTNEKIILDGTIQAIAKLYKIKNIKKTNIPSISFAYDYFRLVSPNIGAKLVKIRAECKMCKILTFGWSILMLVNLKNLTCLGLKEFIIIEAILLFATFGIYQLLQSLNKANINAIFNFWILLHYEK